MRLAIGPQRRPPRRVVGDRDVRDGALVLQRRGERLRRVLVVTALEHDVDGVLVGQRRRQRAVRADQREPVGEEEVGGLERREPAAQPGDERDGVGERAEAEQRRDDVRRRGDERAAAPR